MTAFATFFNVHSSCKIRSFSLVLVKSPFQSCFKAMKSPEITMRKTLKFVELQLTYFRRKSAVIRLDKLQEAI